MIMPNSSNQPAKCFRCKTVVAAYEDSFQCMYCQDNYCPPCLGFTKYFDMAELEHLIKAQ